MTLRDWFWLYRPTAPSTRAQSVQVVNAAHAMAARGHRVELCVEGEGSPDEILAAYGLAPVPTLRLVVLPGRRTVASALYRARFAAWAAQTGGRGVALARRKHHAEWALRWLGARFRLVLEVHEVDSAVDRERWFALEQRVLRSAWGVVANAPGTLALLRETHPVLPPAIVLHNGARPGVPAETPGAGIGIVGSVRPYKDPETVARAAERTAQIVTWVGGEGAPRGGRLQVEAAVPYRAVPERLARFRTLLLPLSPGLFGEQLTSPLKLWDALQSGIPLVAADTPAVRACAEGAYVPYVPGDAGSLVDALDRTCTDEALRARVVARARVLARTWDGRAAELEAFVDGILP